MTRNKTSAVSSLTLLMYFIGKDLALDKEGLLNDVIGNVRLNNMVL